MPTYVALYKWTDEGAKNIKETVNRADQAIQLAEKLGAKVLGLYWTQGAYDLISVGDFPDEDSIEVFLLQLASAGAVRTETMRAFTREDMQRILGKLG